MNKLVTTHATQNVSYSMQLSASCQRVNLPTLYGHYSWR